MDRAFPNIGLYSGKNCYVLLELLTLNNLREKHLLILTIYNERVKHIITTTHRGFTMLLITVRAIR